ncbi:MAG: hypothetical protein OQK45_02860 [Sulfurovum sp.]|nr:hypothetical protein [Sulfurovum sp.]
MDIPNFYEEIIAFGVFLVAVIVVYIMLKLHYHFAFGLMKNTSSYEKNKLKIDKAKKYLFFILKVLLWFGLIGMFAFCIYYLSEGMSLKALLFELWAKIPEGFWISLFFTLLRIAVLIIISRYLLRKMYVFLDKQQQKTINKKVYNKTNVEKVYLRIHNTIKFTVVFGIVYRITHFFPLLVEVSAVMFVFLILYFIVAVLFTLREVMIMLKEKRGNNG